MENSKGFTYFLWNNKIFLSIVLLIFIAVTSFVTNGSLLVFFLALLVLFITIKRESFKDIGFTKPKSWGKAILWGTVLGLAIHLFTTILLDPLLEIITGEELDYSQFDDMRGNIVLLLIWLLVGWVIGGFLEEMSFRGFMISRIRYLFNNDNLSTVLAVFLTAIPFGLAHAYQGESGIISTALVGIIFAVIYIRNGYNLWIPIIAHGMVDTFGLIFIYFSYDIAVKEWVKTLF